MAVAAPIPRRFTPEEYLLLERQAEYKSEYLDGEIYAMAGGSPMHNLISGNLLGELRDKLRKVPCRVLSSDMKVRTSIDGLYAYPDVTVACGEMRFHDKERDVLLNPTVVVEVLSPSTEDYDRKVKAARYEEIESLREYLFAAQTEPRVEVFTRSDKGAWQKTVAEGLDGQVRLESIGCTLLLSEVYDKVDFEMAKL